MLRSTFNNFFSSLHPILGLYDIDIVCMFNDLSYNTLRKAMRTMKNVGILYRSTGSFTGTLGRGCYHQFHLMSILSMVSAESDVRKTDLLNYSSIVLLSVEWAVCGERPASKGFRSSIEMEINSKMKCVRAGRRFHNPIVVSRMLQLHWGRMKCLVKIKSP